MAAVESSDVRLVHRVLRLALTGRVAEVAHLALTLLDGAVAADDRVPNVAADLAAHPPGGRRHSSAYRPAGGVVRLPGRAVGSVAKATPARVAAWVPRRVPRRPGAILAAVGRRGWRWRHRPGEELRIRPPLRDDRPGGNRRWQRTVPAATARRAEPPATEIGGQTS